MQKTNYSFKRFSQIHIAYFLQRLEHLTYFLVISRIHIHVFDFKSNYAVQQTWQYTFCTPLASGTTTHHTFMFMLLCMSKEKGFFFQTFLRKELEKYLSSDISSPSLRKFSTKLGVNSGTLSKVLSGQRGLNAENTARIIKSLNITEVEKNLFLKSIVEFRSKHFTETPPSSSIILNELQNQLYQKNNSGAWIALETESLTLKELDEKINWFVKQAWEKIKIHSPNLMHSESNPIGIFIHFKDIR